MQNIVDKLEKSNYTFIHNPKRWRKSGSLKADDRLLWRWNNMLFALLGFILCVAVIVLAIDKTE